MFFFSSLHVTHGELQILFQSNQHPTSTEQLVGYISVEGHSELTMEAEITGEKPRPLLGFCYCMEEAADASSEKQGTTN